jgi:hypothetical protein
MSHLKTFNQNFKLSSATFTGTRSNSNKFRLAPKTSSNVSNISNSRLCHVDPLFSKQWNSVSYFRNTSVNLATASHERRYYWSGNPFSSTRSLSSSGFQFAMAIGLLFGGSALGKAFTSGILTFDQHIQTLWRITRHLQIPRRTSLRTTPKSCARCCVERTLMLTS